MQHHMPAYPPAGTPVYVPVAWGVFKHFGIVSDRWCDGAPMVISRSRRVGRAVEESWETFRDGRQVFSADLRTALPAWQVIARARIRLGSEWDLWTANCEHLVREALGLSVSSAQLWGTAGAVAVGVFIGHSLTPPPR